MKTLLAPATSPALRSWPRDSAAPVIDAEFAAIVDELTRRGLLGGGLGAAALLGLAACGSSSSAAEGRPASPATRLVGSVNGKIRVPASPKRVVAVYTAVDTTLWDLGVSPAGVFDEGAQYVSPRYHKQYTAAPKINSVSSIDLEKIATLHPDLIIGSDVEANTSIYSQLTAIAPTVITPLNPWQGLASATADAMNKMSVLEQLEKKLTQRSAQIKTQYAGVLSRFRWDLLQGGFGQGQFWVYGPNSLAGLALAGAGVQFATASTSAASSRTPGFGIRSISYENIGQLRDADAIAYYSTYAGAPNNMGAQLFAQKLWKDLPAVKAGRLVPISDFLVGGYGDALAVLNELEAGLKKLK